MMFSLILITKEKSIKAPSVYFFYFLYYLTSKLSQANAAIALRKIGKILTFRW